MKIKKIQFSDLLQFCLCSRSVVPWKLLRHPNTCTYERVLHYVLSRKSKRCFVSALPIPTHFSASVNKQWMYVKVGNAHTHTHNHTQSVFMRKAKAKRKSIWFVTLFNFLLIMANHLLALRKIPKPNSIQSFVSFCSSNGLLLLHVAASDRRINADFLFHVLFCFYLFPNSNFHISV